MKYFLSVTVLALTLIGVQANADWQCTMSCGSKGQEPKVGRSWDQHDAREQARSQICTRYEGGNPKYDQGCTYINNTPHQPPQYPPYQPPHYPPYQPPYYPPHNPYDPNPYDPNPYQPPHHQRQVWQCTYSCGSKGQEQKVGQGRTPDEARYDAQYQTCTRYEGGNPKYFQGCKRIR